MGIYIFINLGYTLFSPKSVNHVTRTDGFNIAARQLALLNATKQDVVISIPLGGYLSTKYDYKARVVPLCMNDYSFNSGETFRYIFDEDFIKSINKYNIYYKLKNFVSSKQPTDKFRSFIKHDVSDSIPKGRYIYVALLNYGLLKYDKRHMIDGLRGKLLKDTFSIINSDKRFKLINIKYSLGWAFFIFKRIS